MYVIPLFYLLTMFYLRAAAWQETLQKFPGLPGYNFQYFIRNDETGDFKSQQEVREGDTVRGTYSLADPNGDLRVVTYHADQNSGFNAKVQVQPRGIPIPFPPIKSFHPMMSPPSSNYHPVDIKVLPPSTTTEPSRKTVEINIEDEKAPETSERAPLASTPSPVKLPCSFDHFENRHRPQASAQHQKVVPTLSSVPITPLYFQPTGFDHLKHPLPMISTQHRNNGPVKPPALNPLWAFILVPAQG